MPRILSHAISIVGYKYEHPFQRLIDDLINYEFYYFLVKSKALIHTAYNMCQLFTTLTIAVLNTHFSVSS